MWNPHRILQNSFYSGFTLKECDSMGVVVRTGRDSIMIVIVTPKSLSHALNPDFGLEELDVRIQMTTLLFQK